MPKENLDLNSIFLGNIAIAAYDSKCICKIFKPQNLKV